MDSVEEEITIRKRLKNPEADGYTLPKLIPTKAEVKEILQQIRPIYIQSKVEDVPMQLTYADFTKTLFGTRLVVEANKLRVLNSKHPNKHIREENERAKLKKQLPLDGIDAFNGW